MLEKDFDQLQKLIFQSLLGFIWCIFIPLFLFFPFLTYKFIFFPLTFPATAFPSNYWARNTVAGIINKIESKF